jgi:DNA-directed RNA polymerase subunit RPC12/RpoP
VRAPQAPAPVDPFELWQEITNAPGEYQCDRCGQTKTGPRYVALEAQGHFDPGAMRGLIGISRAMTRVARRIRCPDCRWARAVPQERPRRRKTEL